MALEVSYRKLEDTARIDLSGDLDASSAHRFKDMVELAATQHPRRLVVVMTRLRSMTGAGLGVLLFAKERMGATVELLLVGAREAALAPREAGEALEVASRVTPMSEGPEVGMSSRGE